MPLFAFSELIWDAVRGLDEHPLIVEERPCGGPSQAISCCDELVCMLIHSVEKIPMEEKGSGVFVCCRAVNARLFRGVILHA